MLFRDFITVKKRNESTKVFIKDIILIERRYRKIFLMTSERMVEYYEKLVYIEPLLGENFFQVIDGCFINLEKVISARDGLIYFENGYKLQLSERGFVKAKRNHYAYTRLRQLRSAAEVVLKN